MISIINNTDYTFTPNEQGEIRKAAAWAGLDEVYTQKTQDSNIFHFYDEDSNYVFSIDTDADGDCVIWSRR